MAKADLTAERLRELLHYDPETGLFTWLEERHGVIKGAIAGTVFGHRYTKISIFGKRYYAHRLVWLYFYGRLPYSCVDHINGNGHDNKIANLREATHAENGQNMKVRVNNTTGLTGASFHNQTGKWRSQITVNRKNIYLGLFASAELAHAEYLAAKKVFHTLASEQRATS